MVIRTSYWLVVLYLAWIASVPAALANESEAAKPKTAPRIELAILLDTSNSMDGLINQAKAQLWKIVNEFATSTRDGQRPELHVAIFEYGNDSLPAEQGHIRMVVPLTDNLDQVSEALFALTTNGGSEYCGQVIDVAAGTLKWSASNKDLKCIFIAGNEAFTQGTVDFRSACHTAASKGITVSTIFCGAHEEGKATMWAEGAKLADGSYMSINHEQVVQEIAAPQDQELARLSTELNKTYVAYGVAEVRDEALERQVAQDANATGLGLEVAASRALTKGSTAYNNSSWDLCDALRCKTIKLEDLTEDQLPDELKNMTVEQRKAHIDKLIKERESIQKEIQDLSKDRDAYVAKQRRQQAEQSGATLDVAIIDAVRKQAAHKDFKFEK